MKTVGIVGGLGPETSCSFCLNINRKFKKIKKEQPHLLLDNLPISRKAEEKIIRGGISREHLSFLKDSIRRLNKARVHGIVIPCNTVHVFIEELRATTRVPILSIVEETVKICKKKKFRKVGLLASTKTVQGRLYAKELNKKNIGVIIPKKEDQEWISNCIIHILNNETNDHDKIKMAQLIRRGSSYIRLYRFTIVNRSISY